MYPNILLLFTHLRVTGICNTSDDEDGWFGKLNIILFGDLLQLPPVRERFIFEELDREKIDKCVGAMETYHLWSLFEYDELTINMRQKNDDEYFEILSRIRLGVVVKTITFLFWKKGKLIFPVLDAIKQYVNYVHIYINYQVILCAYCPQGICVTF